MKLNNITCLEYSEDAKQLTAVFQDTTLEELKKLPSGNLTITTDTGTYVKTLTAYGSPASIAYDTGTTLYTVVFYRAAALEASVSALQRTAVQLEQDNKQLTAKLEASIKSNQMLEDCLVEMAEIVYA